MSKQSDAEVAAIKKQKEAVEKLDQDLEKELELLRKTVTPKAAFESRLHALAAGSKDGCHVFGDGEDIGDGIFGYSLYAEHHFEVDYEHAEYLKDERYTVTYLSKDLWGNRCESDDGMHAECQDHDVYILEMHVQVNHEDGEGETKDATTKAP